MKFFIRNITVLSVAMFTIAAVAQSESRVIGEGGKKPAISVQAVASAALSLEMVESKNGGFTAVVYFDADQVDPVAAGSFILEYPANSFSVDASACVVDLPSSHTGQCAVRESEGEVRVIFFSGTNAQLGSGVIGSVDFNGLRNAGAENITMTSISLGGIDGKSVIN